MRTVKNVKLESQKGVPFIDNVTKRQIDALACFKAILNNVEYANREEQRASDKIFDKLEEVDNDIETLELEDTDFDLLKKYASTYKPFLVGRMFSPFMEELEQDA